MKRVLLGILFAGVAFADFNPGDLVTNYCWTDGKGLSHCLKDTDGKTRVLMYSASWCGPCNTEMSEMGKSKLKADVIYISLLCDSHGASSVVIWDKKHGLSKNGIAVFQSLRDCARDFGGSSIPSVAVIEGNGRLRVFRTAPGVAWILKQ